MNREFRATAASIYAEYAPYAQGAGSEQRVFDQAGKSSVRSRRLADYLEYYTRTESSGTIIDFGCGNGAFLREFLGRNPEWSGIGVDSAAHLADDINAIPNVEFVSQLELASDIVPTGQSPVITMIHSLEHVDNPQQMLEDVLQMFPTSTVLVQVPDNRANLFDFVVADHRMHFTRDSLNRVLSSVFGPHSFRVVEGLVKRELTAIAGPAIDASEETLKPRRTALDVKGRLAILHEFLHVVRTIAEDQPVSIFGSSIAASWIAGSLFDGSVLSFVDEDESRIGGTHLDIPIVSPAQVPNESIIVLPLERQLASSLCSRLGLSPANTLCLDYSPASFSQGDMARWTVDGFRP